MGGGRAKLWRFKYWKAKSEPARVVTRAVTGYSKFPTWLTKTYMVWRLPTSPIFSSYTRSPCCFPICQVHFLHRNLTPALNALPALLPHKTSPCSSLLIFSTYHSTWHIRGSQMCGKEVSLSRSSTQKLQILLGLYLSTYQKQETQLSVEMVTVLQSWKKWTIF